MTVFESLDWLMAGTEEQRQSCFLREPHNFFSDTEELDVRAGQDLIILEKLKVFY